MKTLAIFAITVAGFAAALAPQQVLATAPPAHVATIVIHGFDESASQDSGVFGVDDSRGYITEIAGVLGLPLSTVDPLAPNQVAYATYYGDQFPSYYTSQDIADVQAVTLESNGGVPRYAIIMAKFCKEVMRRSGAKQVNLFASSFGGLISRYIIEKDVEGLASSGKIARWICIEGMVAGNWAASEGGSTAEDFFDDHYDAEDIDLQHLRYEWVENHINQPRKTSVSPFLGQIPVHFWLACDDDFNDKFLTLAAEEANDGVGLIDDQYLHNLPVQCQYLGLNPTISASHTNHDSTRDFEGLRAAAAAQLFGRKRVTVTLEQARIRQQFDDGRGDGEFVFGLRVFSPQALAQYGIDKTIHQLRSDDNNTPYFSLEQDTTATINLAWFDDMILPGETQLNLESNVDEIDGDFLYDIDEEAGESIDELQDTTLTISTLVNAKYTMETEDWRGVVDVKITDYPAFVDPIPETAAECWDLY